jgi:hypothetical protein
LEKNIHQKKGWWSGSRCRPWVQIPVPQKKKKECFTPPSGILLQATNAHVSEAGEDSCGQANRLGGPPSSVRGSLNFKDVGEKWMKPQIRPSWSSVTCDYLRKTELLLMVFELCFFFPRQLYWNKIHTPYNLLI